MYVDESSERDNLLQYEEPSDLYTGATFVNNEDVQLTSYNSDGRNTSGGVNDALLNSDSDDEEVAFDLSEYKSSNQVDVDVKALLRTRNPNHES